MAEYIDREVLIKRLTSAGAISDWGLYLIKDEPAADVRPERHGHWVAKEFSERGYSKHYTYINYFCSECGRRLKGYSSPNDAPYCHCGAKMDGEDGD